VVVPTIFHVTYEDDSYERIMEEMMKPENIKRADDKFGTIYDEKILGGHD